MVKYGSTVRIAVLPLYDNEPLYAIPVTLADTYAAQDTIKKGAEKVRDWLYMQGPLLKRYQDITDDQLIELAKSRGLVFNGPEVTFPDLYFVRSRTGNTGGHYIEVDKSGVTCSCPGFTNRGYCWASNTISTKEKWVGLRDEFYRSRMVAYGV